MDDRKLPDIRAPMSLYRSYQQKTWDESVDPEMISRDLAVEQALFNQNLNELNNLYKGQL